MGPKGHSAASICQSKPKLGKGYHTPKVYGDLALLGDRAQGYSQWYHPNREKRWQKLFFIYSKWYVN